MGDSYVADGELSEYRRARYRWVGHRKEGGLVWYPLSGGDGAPSWKYRRSVMPEIAFAEAHTIKQAERARRWPATSSQGLPTTLPEGTMTYKRQGASFDWLALWILLSAWSSISGWCLSAFGCLNPVGTAVSYSLFLVGLILFRSHLRHSGGRAPGKMLRSRFVLPKIWLLLVVLALLGGMAHAPNNYDYLTYRFSRVLHWTWDHGWSWIPTVNARINYSGTGFEWLMAPLFIIFKTDRFFFLINFISCLLLPGVIFSVFSHLGISKRISWWWMWILPCGYCFILQAASAGNDSLAAVYFLASLHYLFQTNKTSSTFKNLALSCLAIALTTGVKACNLPLVLPWLAVLFFHRRCFLERCRPAMVAMVLMAAAVSFLPMALLNIHFTGDYAGDPNNREKLKVSNPVMGVLGNSLQLAMGNLTPPLLPRSIDWDPLLPSSLKVNILHDFPRFELGWGELQIEEEAGLGLGIVLLATFFIVVGIEARLVNPSLIVDRNGRAVVVVAAGAIAGLAFMSKLGSEATARLVAAYYPILIAGILIMVSLDGRIVRRGAFSMGRLDRHAERHSPPDPLPGASVVPRASCRPHHRKRLCPQPGLSRGTTWFTASTLRAQMPSKN